MAIPQSVIGVCVHVEHLPLNNGKGMTQIETSNENAMYRLGGNLTHAFQ